MERDRLVVVLLGFLCLVALGIVLKAAQNVIVPFVIAWMLSYVLGPAIKFMVRRRVPTPVAVMVVVLVLLGVCYLGGAFLYARGKAVYDQSGVAAERLENIIGEFAARFNLPKVQLADVEWGAYLQTIVSRLSGPFMSFVSFVSNLMMVFIFLVFLLLGRPYSEYKIKKAFSSEQASQITGIVGSISHQISGYLIIQSLISLVTGILVWLALTIIGLDFAVTWGAVAFLLNFIPSVGSIIASILPVLWAVVQFYPNPWPVVACAVCLLTIQMLIGNVLAPKIMGDRLDLSPVVILVALLLWGWLWGPVGAVLSVPIACIVKIICANIEALRPISVMMGSGRQYVKEFET